MHIVGFRRNAIVRFRILLPLAATLVGGLIYLAVNRWPSGFAVRGVSAEPATIPDAGRPASSSSLPVGVRHASRAGTTGSRASAASAGRRGRETRANPAVQGKGGPQEVSRPDSSELKSPAAVLSYLEQTHDLAAAEESLSRFARDGDGQVPDLAPFLRSPDPDAVGLGARVLAELGTDAALAELLKAFSALPEDSDVHRQVGDAITAVSNPAAAPFLLSQLLSGDADEAAVDVMQRALANLADPALLATLAADYAAAADAAVKARLADTVRHVQNPTCAPALAELLQAGKGDCSDPLVAAAADTLAMVGTPAAVQALIGQLTVPETTDTSGLLAALSRVRNPDALPVLKSAALGSLPNAGTELRLAAIVALGTLPPDQSGSVLQGLAVRDPDPQIRNAAREMLRLQEPPP